jgi:hypothetical protein
MIYAYKRKYTYEYNSMSDVVRWTLNVSKETDIALRTFLAHQGARKGDLSKFVEDAVRWRVLDRTVSDVKSKNAHVSPEELQAAIEEALHTIRAERFKPAA